MKAAFLTGIRKIEVRDVPAAKIQRPTDVLLNVETVGVCGSDMHYYRTGRIGDQVVQFPFIVGHECAATVAEVGEGVTRVKVGQRVAVDPLVWCHQCDQCRAGRVHTCRDQYFLGVPTQMEGCLKQQLVMPEDSCFSVPDTMMADQATMAEPLSIALWAQRLAGDPAGKDIAVLGAGPIGLCVLLCLKATGACDVSVTDRLDYRVDMARRCGADWAGPAGDDIAADPVASRKPLGFDIVFECAGEQQAIDQAGDLLKPGGLLVIVGIPEADRISFKMDTLRRKELRVQNVRRQNECVADAIDLIASGRVNVDPLITHHFPLGRTAEALDTVADYRDNVVKAMVQVGQ